MKLFYSTSVFILLFLSGTTFSQSPIVRLIINTTNFNDETVFYFQQGGTTSFQSDMDAYKLIPNQGQYPYIGSLSDSILTSISGLPQLPVNLSITVKAISPSTKTFTFSTDTTNFPNNVCVTLYDSFTGITTNILTSNYVCTLYDSTSIARFKMNFFTLNSEGISSLKHPVCNSPEGGLIVASGAGSGPWNFEWSVGDSVIKSCNNKTISDSLTNLSGGIYSVRVNNVGQCSAFTRTFEINPVVIPWSSFTSDSFTTSLSNSGLINFTNTSTGNQFNSWEFGDNTGTWLIPSPSHAYTKGGTYTVTLMTESISHCKETSSQVITVIDDITGISKIDLSNNVLLATLSQGNYELKLNFDQSTDIQIQLYDLKGTVLQKVAHQNVTTTNQFIDLSSFAQGMYLLKLTSKDGSQKTFKLLN